MRVVITSTIRYMAVMFHPYLSFLIAALPAPKSCFIKLIQQLGDKDTVESCIYSERENQPKIQSCDRLN